jgi:hypothetical protein
MALSRGDNGGATIVYIGTRERREVPLFSASLRLQHL